MTFSRKIFISVFCTALILGSLAIWTSHRYVSRQTEEKFISRYSVFTKVLSNTLTSLDINTEALMLNAAKVVAAKDAANGLLPTETLKSMRDELSVTHIFVVDRQGKFVRSTNEDPSLIPNAYSFCPAYQEMITGNSKMEATPIIHPRPEPKPYKFLFIPSVDKQRLLEVGVRIDFIAKTLTEALGSDENISSMSLYDPHGTLFGRFTSNEADLKSASVKLPEDFPRVVETDNAFHFFTKVKSSHPQCCQCDVSKTSMNGEYYYVLEANVSKGELNTILASTKATFLLLGFGNFVLALFLSRFLSRRLVQNIEKAAKKVQQIQTDGDLKGRINLEGQDEVAFLTKEFDKLLERVEVSQRQLVEAEKVQAKVQMAREVAHNIKSPVVALEMMLPSLSFLPTRLHGVIQSSVKEIKSLTERLRAQADSLAAKTSGEAKEVLFLPSILNDVVQSKKQEFSARKSISIELHKTGTAKDAFVVANATELKAIFSNLINNGIESYGEDGGSIEITWMADGNHCSISIADDGAGIPQEFLNDMGKKKITFKGGCDRGVGLVHAFKALESWGGRVSIDSTVGIGTSVHISLPKYSAIQKTEPAELPV